MDKLPDTETLVPDEVKTKAELAWDAMLSGRNPHEICDVLGYKDENSITRAISEQLGIEATFFKPNERQALLRMSLYRLDALRKAVWPAAMHGDPQSVDKALKIEQQYMKAAGTDQPDTQTSQHTVLVVGGMEADYISKLKSMTPEVMTGQTSDHSDEEDEDA